MAAGDDRRKDALILSRIRRIRRRHHVQTGLEAAVVPLWCAATAVALYQVLLGGHTVVVLLAALTAAAAVWWWRIRDALLSEEAAAVLLDRGAGAGGLLLTRLERPVGAWELALNERVLNAPAPTVKTRKALVLTSAAALFLLVALLLPAPAREVRTTNAAAQTRVAQVEAYAEALAEVSPLEESMEEALAALREELLGGEFDAADWEAADHLESELAQKAQDAAAQLQRAQDAAKALEQALGDASGADAAAREREALEQALSDLDGGGEDALERALAEMGEGEGEEGESNGANSEGGGENGAPTTGGALTPALSQREREKISELQRALAQRREQLQKSFGQEGKPGQAGGQKPQHAQRSHEGHGHRADGSCEGEGEGEGEGQGQGQGGEGDPKQGKPGIGKGGGPGQLTFDENAEVNPDRLAFAPLPDGQGGDEPGELWGLRAADPKPSTEAGAQGAGGTVAEGRQAPGHDQGAELPRNRALVRRYFEEKAP